MPAIDVLAVQKLLEQGQKIEAVKFVREQTGWGLREALEMVEAIERGDQLPDQGFPSGARDSAPAAAAGRDFSAAVRAFLRKNQKIQAIKFVREHTGLGLKDAKDYVEAIEAGRSATAPPAQPASLEKTALEALRSGNRLEAIKRVMQASGWGLKRSKDFVDALERAETGQPASRKIAAEALTETRLEMMALEDAVAALKANGEIFRAARLVAERTGKPWWAALVQVVTGR